VPMRKSLGLVVCLLFVAAEAKATPINGTATGLTSPSAVLTFSEVALASGTSLTNQFAAFGVTFLGGAYYDPQPGGFFPTVAAGNFSAGGSPPVGLTNPFTIIFTAPVGGAAFQFITNPGSTTFTARLGGVSVESFVAATSTAQLFYGFQGITFDNILINVSTDNNAALFDNIQTGSAVPEPTTMILIGTGVLAALRRRHS
jgi:PEP-CTERM motif